MLYSTLQATLAIGDRELCKYFEPGNHVKVVAGATEGATGMVVSVEGHVVNIVSDTTKELVSYSLSVVLKFASLKKGSITLSSDSVQLRVFADNIVESSEVTTGVTRIGEYELHDLVQLE